MPGSTGTTGTTPTPGPLDARATLLMLCLALTWGFQQVLLKVTAADISPLFQIALRSAAGAILVWVVMRRQGVRLDRHDGTLGAGLLVGVLFALEFLFLGESLRHTSASHLVVFLYTAPIFVALGLHWMVPSERLNAVQWSGVLLAFGGIAAAFLGRGETHDSAINPAMLWGDFLAVLAGLAWGATTVAVRVSALARAPATKTLFYQLAIAGVLLIPLAAALGQFHLRPTPLVLASLVFHSVVVAFGTFLLWFWLLRHYLAARLSVLSFLTPLCGVGFGVWLLDEPLDASFVIGGALVCAGIVLVSGKDWIRRPVGR